MNKKLLLVLLTLLPLKSILAQEFNEVGLNGVSLDLVNSAGHAIADYDLDGDLDIFIVGINTYDSNDLTTKSRLLRNDNGVYTDVTDAAGFANQLTNESIMAGMGDDMGASWGDFDNNGYPDLILTHYGKVELFYNKGDGTFDDITAESGITACEFCYNASALWWDYNKDGLLDFYISDWVKENKLYKNNGDGTFEDVSVATKTNDASRSWTALPIDINRDGWLDLYIANDFGDNVLYLSNEGVDFTNVASTYGVDDSGDGMGLAFGDYNNDGNFDIYVTNIYKRHANPLFLANTDGKPYENTAIDQGVDNAAWAWGTSFFDADLDGDEDLYVANGFNDPLSSDVDENRLFKNMRSEGQETFTDISVASKTNGDLTAFAASTFDIDNDGDLDILVSNTNGAPYLYENLTIEKNKSSTKKWFKVDLEGTTSNRNAFGTEVVVYAGNNVYHRLYHGAGYLSQNIKEIHFGLADHNQVDKLVIKWPNSADEVFENLKTNQTVKAVEHTSFEGEDATLAVDDFESLKNTLKVYPNPFQNNVVFNLGDVNIEKGDLSIYTVTGALVYQSSFSNKNSVDWNGSALLSGAYFYKLTVSGKVYTGFIVKE